MGPRGVPRCAHEQAWANSISTRSEGLPADRPPQPLRLPISRRSWSPDRPRVHRAAAPAGAARPPLSAALPQGARLPIGRRSWRQGGPSCGGAGADL
ncbi:unnamed protein product [Prorocentrum cordatum]|uniref:Uncharacterized protein n=1 Tax=Prorocentrum cordatum TaxID=2364126 RepID=A0ABN9XJ24_9DINO|nr:unnamed protein product [Polarella glacialis]